MKPSSIIIRTAEEILINHILSSRIKISVNPGWRVLSDINLSGIQNKDKSGLSRTWVQTILVHLDHLPFSIVNSWKGKQSIFPSTN